MGREGGQNRGAPSVADIPKEVEGDERSGNTEDHNTREQHHLEVHAPRKTLDAVREAALKSIEIHTHHCRHRNHCNHPNVARVEQCVGCSPAEKVKRDLPSTLKIGLCEFNYSYMLPFSRAMAQTRAV